MKVYMTKLSASPTGVLEAGRTYDLKAARARALIKAGAAVAVEEPRRPRRRSSRQATSAGSGETADANSEEPLEDDDDGGDGDDGDESDDAAGQGEPAG